MTTASALKPKRMFDPTRRSFVTGRLVHPLPGALHRRIIRPRAGRVNLPTIGPGYPPGPPYRWARMVTAVLLLLSSLVMAHPALEIPLWIALSPVILLAAAMAFVVIRHGFSE